MHQRTNKIIRIITAIPLGLMAFMFLLTVPSAHVTMCMLYAVGYAVTLPLYRWEGPFRKATSFFAGGILFYTVFAGTTPLLFSWFSGRGWEPPVWGYHFIINFALLALFLTKKNRTGYVLQGLAIAMIISPAMYLMNFLFDRSLDGEEHIIPFYIAGGAFILAVYQILARLRPKLYPKMLKALRYFFIYSLLAFAVLMLVVLPFVFRSP